MSFTPSSTPKGFMLKSTACILAAVTFVAGLLAGSLFSSPTATSSRTPATMAAESISETPADVEDQELAAHITQVRSEISRKPEDPLHWVHLGNLYFDAQKPTEAIEAYQTALNLKPGNVDVMTDLGTMYRLAREPQKAVAMYDQAIALNPVHQNAHFNKGMTLMADLGQPAAGMAVWKALLTAKPDATLSDGTPLGAALAPLATDAGTSLEQRGNSHAALEAYNQALAEQADFAPALAHKAALLEKSGLKDQPAPLHSNL